MADINSDLKLEELEEATEFLSRKWRPLIIYTLAERGGMGFNELKKTLENISGKVLSENLEDLTDADYVRKEVISENPKRVKYSLTSEGYKLEPILRRMLDWAESSETEKVLIVEDEDQLVELYSKWLNKKYEVVKASSGSEATDKMDSSIDVVLLDRGLPDSSGEELAGKFKDYFDCQVVFLTAQDPEVEIVDMDIDDYLVKPVSEDELIGKVDEIADRTKERELKQELLALTSRKEVIEKEHSKENLEEEEKYHRLLERIREIREKVV